MPLPRQKTTFRLTRGSQHTGICHAGDDKMIGPSFLSDDGASRARFSQRSRHVGPQVPYRPDNHQRADGRMHEYVDEGPSQRPHVAPDERSWRRMGLLTLPGYISQGRADAYILNVVSGSSGPPVPRRPGQGPVTPSVTTVQHRVIPAKKNRLPDVCVGYACAGQTSGRRAFRFAVSCLSARPRPQQSAASRHVMQQSQGAKHPRFGRKADHSPLSSARRPEYHRRRRTNVKLGRSGIQPYYVAADRLRRIAFHRPDQGSHRSALQPDGPRRSRRPGLQRSPHSAQSLRLSNPDFSRYTHHRPQRARHRVLHKWSHWPLRSAARPWPQGAFTFKTQARHHSMMNISPTRHATEYSMTIKLIRKIEGISFKGLHNQASRHSASSSHSLPTPGHRARSPPIRLDSENTYPHRLPLHFAPAAQESSSTGFRRAAGCCL